LQEARKKLEIAEKKALEDMQRAEKLYQGRRGDSVAARTTANNRSDELKRLGDEATLQTGVSEATKKLEAAQLRLNAAQLSESEKTIPQRLKDAQTALELRRERLNDLRGEINRHRGRLEASEGLHPKLSNAEAELEDAQKRLARATLAANAHTRLRDLFEECRNSRVQCVMGPVEKRVLEWAESVGLREYRQFRFGDQFLPEGVIVRSDQTAQPRSLQEESYGIGEQLSLLVRLALGGVLAKDEKQVAILDDPLAHADRLKHERILELLRRASEGAVDSDPPAGRLQILILTCHPDRFDHLPGATQINLAEKITRES
jgi:DNA repair exonuclease SbcCD ATPase subunit